LTLFFFGTSMATDSGARFVAIVGDDELIEVI
jgi:hypothetical protein